MKERTQLAAESLANWIKENFSTQDVRVDSARNWGSSELGHVVFFEGNEEDMYDITNPDAPAASIVKFMGCFVELVNLSVIGVYPIEEYAEEAATDVRLVELFDIMKQQTR